MITRQKLYNLIKQEALTRAETDLRDSLTRGQQKTINPDWHPYYMRVQRTDDGVKFSLVVRDGEAAYFTEKKIKQPDWETPAINAMEAALTKYRHELLTLELVETFNKTEGMKAEWLPDQNQ